MRRCELLGCVFKRIAHVAQEYCYLHKPLCASVIHFLWQDLYQACPDDHSQGNDGNNNDTGEKAVFTNVAKSI